MTIVYLVALIAVYVVFFGVLYEAVVSVSRKPVWVSSMPKLALVETVDRRKQRLPFVGQDRRQPAAGEESVQDASEQPPRRVA